VKARAENAASDARQALKEEASLDRLRDLTTELRQVSQELAAAGTGPQTGPGPQAGPAGGGSDDDVIDAEFTPTE
jgi:molecular chaperone DnaK